MSFGAFNIQCKICAFNAYSLSELLFILLHSFGSVINHQYVSWKKHEVKYHHDL